MKIAFSLISNVHPWKPFIYFWKQKSKVNSYSELSMPANPIQQKIKTTIPKESKGKKQNTVNENL